MPRPRGRRRLRYVDDPVWSSIKEAASLLGVDEQTVRRMVDRWMAGERGPDALKGEWVTPPTSGRHSHRRVARADLQRVIEARQRPAV